MMKDSLNYCSPPLFVALTRVKKELVIINTISHTVNITDVKQPTKLLPFLNINNIEKYTDTINIGHFEK